MVCIAQMVINFTILRKENAVSLKAFQTATRIVTNKTSLRVLTRLAGVLALQMDTLSREFIGTETEMSLTT